MALYNLKSGQITVADTSGTTASDAEIDTLAGVTAGTATASKALVLKADKSIATIGALACAALTATTGTFSGAISGTTITGTGIVTGSQIKAREFVLAMGVDGAVTIPAYSQTIYFTKAGVCAATLANPTATTHDGVRLTFIATQAQANTLDNSAGAGFNGGGAGSDVATFGGAVGDNIVIEAYQGKWYVISSVNVTLA
jgi:hypothetical protein